jgi:hypothetical protein
LRIKKIFEGGYAMPGSSTFIIAEPDEISKQLPDLDAAWNEAAVTVRQILKDWKEISAGCGLA